MERQEGHTPGHLEYRPLVAPHRGWIVACCKGFPEKVIADARGVGDADEREANARRLVACWNALLGISTEALEKLASLPAKERFGALSDIAKLHEMKEE